MGMKSFFLLLTVAMLPLDARAACPSPSTAVDIIEAAEASAEAYRNADLLEFVKTTTRLEAGVPCLAEPLPRNVVAQVHRMMGLRAFVDQKTEKAEQAFGAARGIEPAYRFPETMVPPGHPIMNAYESMSVDTLATKPVPSAAGGYFHFVRSHGRSALQLGWRRRGVELSLAGRRDVRLCGGGRLRSRGDGDRHATSGSEPAPRGERWWRGPARRVGLWGRRIERSAVRQPRDAL